MNFRNAPPSLFIKIGISMLAISLILGIISGVIIAKYYNKKQTYIQNIGVVTGYSTRTELINQDDHINSEEYLTYAPIIEFEVDGKSYSVQYTSYVTNPPALNTEMSLRYNRDNPTDVIFDKDIERIILPVVSAMFLVSGITLIIFGKVKSKREAGW